MGTVSRVRRWELVFGRDLGGGVAWRLGGNVQDSQETGHQRRDAGEDQDESSKANASASGLVLVSHDSGGGGGVQGSHSFACFVLTFPLSCSL